MSEPEKKRRFSNLFKTKDSSSKLGTTGNGSSSPSNVGSAEEEGPRGGRRKLFTQLSESEKSMRRSTLGTAQLSQTVPVAPVAQPAPTGQMTSATAGSKAILFSRPNQPAAAVPELETPFAKMVRQSGNNVTATGRESPASGTLSKQPSNPDNSIDSSAPGSTLRRGSTTSLTAEEKKTRRKSLLAPVQNLFAAMSGETESSSSSAQTGDLSSTAASGGGGSGAAGDSKSSKKKGGGLFGKREKGLDFQTGLQLDDSQAKLQKERQKKLQKELDKIEKEKAKQEKARQTRLLDVLQQTLELGEERAQLPMPSHRSAFAMPMRLPIEA
jgi:hypothetical protein